MWHFYLFLSWNFFVTSMSDYLNYIIILYYYIFIFILYYYIFICVSLLYDSFFYWILFIICHWFKNKSNIKNIINFILYPIFMPIVGPLSMDPLVVRIWAGLPHFSKSPNIELNCHFYFWWDFFRAKYPTIWPKYSTNLVLFFFSAICRIFSSTFSVTNKSHLNYQIFFPYVYKFNRFRWQHLKDAQ